MLWDAAALHIIYNLGHYNSLKWMFVSSGLVLSLSKGEAATYNSLVQDVIL